MAVLYISEYTELPTALYASYRSMAIEPSVVDQTIAIGGTSVRSNPFSGSTNFVRIHADSICSIAFSTTNAATASVSNKRLAQNQTEYFTVTPGGTVAVIANT